MDDLENAKPAENPVPNENGVSAPGTETGSAVAIAATVPQIEPPSAKPADKPGIFGAFKRKRGRPKKNPFAAPTNPPPAKNEIPGENPGNIVPLPAGAPAGIPSPEPVLAALPPANPADYEPYGKACAALVCGIYTVRAEKLRGAAEKKLPVSFVDRSLARLSVPDNIKSDLEEGYAGLAQEIGLPAKGGKLAQIIAGHANLEIHYRAAIRELIDEIRKLPDLRKSETPAPQPKPVAADALE